MNYYLKGFRHYADFSGRASREEYWSFSQINTIFSFFAILLDNDLGLSISGSSFGFIYLL